MPKRTLRGWFEYLDDPKRELDLSEFMAMMLMHIREYTKISMEDVHQARQSTEHTEGMLGTLDGLFASTNPLYAELAGRRARPIGAADE